MTGLLVSLGAGLCVGGGLTLLLAAWRAFIGGRFGVLPLYIPLGVFLIANRPDASNAGTILLACLGFAFFWTGALTGAVLAARFACQADAMFPEHEPPEWVKPKPHRHGGDR